MSEGRRVAKPQSASVTNFPLVIDDVARFNSIPASNRGSFVVDMHAICQLAIFPDEMILITRVLEMAS